MINVCGHTDCNRKLDGKPHYDAKPHSLSQKKRIRKRNSNQNIIRESNCYVSMSCKDASHIYNEEINTAGERRQRKHKF